MNPTLKMLLCPDVHAPYHDAAAAAWACFLDVAERRKPSFAVFDVVVLGLGAALVLAWAVAYVTLRLANYANSQGDDDHPPPDPSVDPRFSRCDRAICVNRPGPCKRCDTW